MSTSKIIYYVSTVALTLLMCFSAYNYFFEYDKVAGFFKTLGYPTHIIYPLAIAKIIGLIIIWRRKPGFLKEWAYAGFFFDTLLAFVAHYMAEDGGGMFAIVGMVLVISSRISEGIVFGDN